MSSIFSHISISVDGFAAGPNQSLENPLGEGGMRLHQWVFTTAHWARMTGQPEPPRTADSDLLDELAARPGAYVMGRRMFGGGEGAWDPGWRGWWGDEPPYHAPVFVLTHHPREPLEMQGGTTFHFVTAGLATALELAREAAKGRDVLVPGGAATIAQCLRSGELEELTLHVVPVVLGAGEALFRGAGDPRMTPVEVIASPAVTHVRYRVEGQASSGRAAAR